MPEEITPSQRALQLLCGWLTAATKADSDRCSGAYFKFILSPATKVKRYVQIRYRFDDEMTSDALQDLFLDHLERLGARQAYADEVERLLEPTWISSWPSTLRAQMEQWAVGARDAVLDVTRLPFQLLEHSPAALEECAHRCNERIRSLRDNGADLLVSALAERGVHLALSTIVADEEPGAISTDEDAIPADPGGTSSPAPTKVLGSARRGPSQRLDRLFSRVKDLDHERQKAELLGLKRLALTGLGADTASQELFFRLGRALFALARVRLPLLRQIYSIARFAAVDAARERRRMISLDERADRIADDDGENGAGDIGLLARRGGFGSQSIDGDARHAYFDDGDATWLLQDLEHKIRLGGLQGRKDGDLDTRTATPATSEGSLANELELRDFDNKVRRHVVDGRTLDEIAELLGVPPGRVRKALVRLFKIDVFELDAAGYTQEEIAAELRTTRDRVRLALDRIDQAIGRRRGGRTAPGMAKAVGQGAPK